MFNGVSVIIIYSPPQKQLPENIVRAQYDNQARLHFARHAVQNEVVFVKSILLLLLTYNYGTQNSKWDFQVVPAFLNLSARVAKSSIRYCEYYRIIKL